MHIAIMATKPTKAEAVADIGTQLAALVIEHDDLATTSDEVMLCIDALAGRLDDDEQTAVQIQVTLSHIRPEPLPGMLAPVEVDGPFPLRIINFGVAMNVVGFGS